MEQLLNKKQLEHSVKYSLKNFQKEILPLEISKDYNVDWVLRFGNLDEKENYYKDSDNPLSNFIAPIIKNYVTYNITFYFATLFHIGRLWKVSELAICDLDNALNEKNLSKTIDVNQDIFFQNIPSKPLSSKKIKNDIYLTLSELLQEAKELHNNSLKKSKYFWKIWLNEIDEFRKVLDRLTEQYYNQDRHNYKDEGFGLNYTKILSTLSNFSYESRKLNQLLTEDGVKIKNNPKQNIFSELNLNNPFSILTSFSGLDSREIRYFLEDYWREYNRSIESQKNLLELQRYTPIIEQAERNLLKLFENRNPFDEYSVLKKIPDENLKSLWHKCQLPHNQTFYYASNWLNSLVEKPYFSYKEFPYKENIEKEAIYEYSKSLDSSIKRKWVESTKPIGTTTDEFIQSIFENDWIKEIVKGATYPQRDKKKLNWTLDSLKSLFDSVCENMKQFGYKIEVPSNHRLEKLWNIYLKDSYFSDDW